MFKTKAIESVHCPLGQRCKQKAFEMMIFRLHNETCYGCPRFGMELMAELIGRDMSPALVYQWFPHIPQSSRIQLIQENIE